MSISPITFKADNKVQMSAQKIENTQHANKKSENPKDFYEELGMQKPSPIVQGLLSACIWFGIGYGIDRLLGKMFKALKGDNKLSLMINGAFGVLMGGMTFWRAHKENKSA